MVVLGVTLLTLWRSWRAPSSYPVPLTTPSMGPIVASVMNILKIRALITIVREMPSKMFGLPFTVSSSLQRGDYCKLYNMVLSPSITSSHKIWVVITTMEMSIQFMMKIYLRTRIVSMI